MKAHTYPVLALGCFGGTDISIAIDEAIDVAKATRQEIYLIHNVTVRVFPDSAPQEVMDEWNRKMNT